MPNCYQLIRKSTGQAAKLNEIDEELCKMLGVPVHPTMWVNAWHNTIGFGLACGRSFDQLREEERQRKDEWVEVSLKIIDYLDANFTPNVWVQIGK